MGEKQGVSRRTALKLAAVGGTYGLTRAFGLGGPRSAFAQGSDTCLALCVFRHQWCRWYPVVRARGEYVCCC